MCNMETWKYSEKYNCEVSNLGNVRNHKTKKVFSTKPNRDYLRNHKGKIHRIVAETWIDNPNNYRCVNHIDGNKHNNRVDNLEWCNHSMNMKHAMTNLLHPKAKLGWELVDKIRKEYANGNISTYGLADKYNVTQGAIWHLVTNKTY